ncbi:MAG: STAS domain-containing protein [Bacillota bacterium]|jgi:anti-sigma B factor antagonist|nr:STAS domain-containing protein [Bacillota bacterium]
MSLEIESMLQGKDIVVKPIGEVDIYTSPQLKTNVFALIEDNKKDIIIDGESLVYIDSTGLGVLMSIYKNMKERNLNFKIVNLKPNIYKLFDITGLNKVFDIRE